MWLIWMTGEKQPIAVATNEENAALIVRALNEFDLQIGGEFMADYSPTDDPHDRRFNLERTSANGDTSTNCD